MKLYIARHAFAGPPSLDPQIERSRPLLPEGKATALAIAKAMIAIGEIPKVIFCSPYARTTMNADIFGKAFALATGSGIRVNTIGDLSPDRPLEPSLLNLMSKGELKRAMLVCHMDNTSPGMNNLGGDQKWKDLLMCEVRRVKIDRKSGQWKLKWGIKASDIGLKDYTK